MPDCITEIGQKTRPDPQAGIVELKVEVIMQVLIIENATNNLVAKYTISLQAANYTPSVEEYQNEGWKCAIEDKLVDTSDRGKYSIRVIAK